MGATARDRAEEVLHNLHKKARDLLDAEEGVVKTARKLMEEHGLSPAEVKKRLEEAVGGLKANKVWSRIKSSEAVTTLADYRGEVERYAEESLARLAKSLPLATKEDLKALSLQVAAVSKRVGILARRLDTRSKGRKAGSQKSE